MKSICTKSTMWFLLLLGITHHAANAAYFDIFFDDSSDGAVAPPIVGSGSFSFDGVATDGVFPLLSLTNYSFNFNFSGNTFSNADINTPLSEILIVISGSGSQVNFANINEFGSGSSSGSIDFFKPSNPVEHTLSFEPSDGTVIAIQYFTDNFFGDYGSLSNVPVPAAAWLFASGLTGVIGLARRRKTT